MSVSLTQFEKDMLGGQAGAATAMAMRIVVGTAEMLGAERLVEITSAHIDGCLYHGDSGTEFAERLVNDGGRVAVPTTLNVGSLDLLNTGRVRLAAHEATMARRMMHAYVSLGAKQTWTCAPYQAGHRPGVGEDVAWGESNAVVFCNSVLGARTNRYGDYLDICAAITGRAPYTGLHKTENRAATILVSVADIKPALLDEDAFYPVLGAWLGKTVGSDIAAIEGLPAALSDDRLKSLGAAAASTGAVGLFHIIGTTPEAPTLSAAFQGQPVRETIALTGAMLEEARRGLSTGGVAGGVTSQPPVDAIAVGSPHFSYDEFMLLIRLLDGRRTKLPFYACTGRHVIAVLKRNGHLSTLEAAGIMLIADTCIVVTPILPEGVGLIMTNSGKFAHYTKPNTGWDVVYGSLSDCVATATCGAFSHNAELWT